MKYRVGLGFDVHELKDGAKLFLGGIEIPSDKGAVGHSDADVLIHAICDAMLGAAGMRDIGYHFSNKDERWKNADSKVFLTEVTRLVGEAGWKTENLDCTLVLESPKIGSYVEQMKQTLAPIMGIAPSDISIKATTNETMGYVGRRDGLNAMAVVLLYK